MVCLMEDHVTKFAFVHLLSAFWTATQVVVLACLRGDFHLVDLSATIVLKRGPAGSQRL